MEKREHLGPECPGKAYFEKKELHDKDEIRKIFIEVVGDVPKHMRMAADNRIWLWLITLLTIADTGMVIVLLLEVYKSVNIP